ncbi:MAG: glycosyltransferase family 2 protein [Candidatus Binatia bacterium]
MTEPLVTIAVIPRERFSFTARSLDNICRETEFPFHLLCIDGRSPRAARRALRERAEQYGGEVVRAEQYLTPNEARNLALRQVRTPYVVFIDNDALVTPGWLRALIECAEETGAAICGPLQLIGELSEQRVHLAGGTAHIAEENGRRRFRDCHHHPGANAAEVAPALVRQRTEMIEFHCMLVRMEVFERLGPLDERLLNMMEHADLCLAARAAGLSVFFEPRSVVTYVPPPPLAFADLPYFILRWSEDWTRKSLAHFAAKWQLDPSDSGLEPSATFASWHRRLPLRQARAALKQVLGGRFARGQRALSAAERFGTELIVRATSRRRRGAH